MNQNEVNRTRGSLALAEFTENYSLEGREQQRAYIFADLSLLANKYKNLLVLYTWDCDCGAEWQDTEKGFSSCPNCNSYGKLAKLIGKEKP